MSEPEKWRFIDSGACGAAFNMALDEILLGRVASGQSPPVLRVYCWSSPAVSLGFHQDAADELDLEGCRGRGIEVVRRPTGGRSVYHDAELTYSFAAPGDSDLLGRSVAASSAALNAALRRSLALLEVAADAGGRGGAPGRGAPGRRDACFTASTRHEVAVGGRKLIGSAQVRTAGGRAFLQQGSLLLANDQPKLAGLKPGSLGEEQCRELESKLAAGVTSLREELGRTVDYAEAAGCFRRGFAEHFGVDLVVSGVEREELRMAEQLAERRYASEDWLTGSGQRLNFGLQRSE